MYAFVRLSSTDLMIMLMIMIIIIIFNLATSAKQELLTTQQPRFQTSGQKRPTGTFSFCRGLQNVLFKVSLCTGYFFFFFQHHLCLLPFREYMLKQMKTLLFMKKYHLDLKTKTPERNV